MNDDEVMQWLSEEQRADFKDILQWDRPCDLDVYRSLAETRRALAPVAALGGHQMSMDAFHDLEDDIVVYENSGACLTAGDVRRARLALRRGTT